MANIVIIGGGFGGISAAKRLIKSNNNVTLISDKDHFLFTPLLHEAAAGEISTEHIAIPLRDILKGKNFTFVKSNVDKIDIANNEVSYSKSKVKYDYLLLATGSKINYYGIPGADKYTLNLKTKEEIIKLRAAVSDALEKTSATEDDVELEKLLTFIIAGAGPTGIEYSGDLADFLKRQKSKYPAMKKKQPKIIVVNAVKDILPLMSEKSRQWVTRRLEKLGINLMNNSPITEVGEDFIVIAGKDKVFSHTIIWSAGVRPNELLTEPKLQDERGFFHVNAYLQVEGHENIFAIGDTSFLQGVPALAQSAKAEGIFAAENILNLVSKRKLKEFRFSNKGILVSIGKFYGVGDFFFLGKRIPLSGILPRFLKRAVYLLNLPLLKARLGVLHDWIITTFN